jgi:hypothetical protein
MKNTSNTSPIPRTNKASKGSATPLQGGRGVVIITYQTGWLLGGPLLVTHVLQGRPVHPWQHYLEHPPF